MNITRKWDLDLNNHARLGTLQKFVIAADTNDVSSRALLVCEEFGNTIAMDAKTGDMIKTKIMAAPAASWVTFLGAFLGFSSSDCAKFLSQTPAGRRFLGLATALVSTLGPADGAQALDTMLRSSQGPNETYKPKLNQLKTILANLEPRCQCLGFADKVVHWYTILHEWHTLNEEQRAFWKISYCHPMPEGVDQLVSVFREISMIGDADISSIIIKATFCAPWVIAFTEWCLGSLPLVHLDDDTPIHTQTDSKVTVVASIDVTDCPGIKVSIIYSKRGPKDFVSGAGAPWKGLITVEKYGEWILGQFNILPKSSLHGALQNIVPYAVRTVLECLKFSEYKMPSIYGDASDQNLPEIEERFRELRLSPFGNDTVISKLISRLVGTPIIGLPPLLANTRVVDLPSITSHLDGLRKRCVCTECSSVSLGKGYTQCKIREFLQNVAHITADILALSLFDHSDSVLIWLGDVQQDPQPFKKAIFSIISGGAVATTNIAALLQWALVLVGHGREVTEHIQKSIWIMSSFKGQVVYPKLFETCAVRQRGYLALTLVPGILVYKDSKYEHVVEPIHKHAGSDPLTNICTEAVSRPRNLLPSLALGWRVKIINDILEVAMGLNGGDESYIHTRLSPFYALINLSSALFLNSCEHHRSAAFDPPNPFSSYTGPLQPATWRSSTISDPTPRPYIPVGVVAVDGDRGLRLLALSAGNQREQMVLREDACLPCCLYVCQGTNFPIVIT